MNIEPTEFGKGDGTDYPTGDVQVGSGDTAEPECEDLGDPDGQHYVEHDIPPAYNGATYTCGWSTVLEPDEGEDLRLHAVYAFGYDNGVSGPTAVPADWGAKFGADRDGMCNHSPNVPARVLATGSLAEEEEEEECYNVAVGTSENEDIVWVGYSAIDEMASFPYDICLADCNGGAVGCSTSCNPPGSVPFSCAGTYYLEQPATTVPCENYGPVGMDIQGSIVGVPPSSSGAAEGSAGSGEFLLMPTSIDDHDGDGQYHARLIPIQLSGTGKPTANAVITGITSVTIPSGASLRRINNGVFSFKWANNDSLIDATGISHSITGSMSYATPKPLSPGVFVATGIAESSLDDFRVSMSWTVGTNNGPTRAQGWSFKLADIGCSTYVQSFTIRRLTSPERVSIEPYGVPGEGVTFPATAQSWGTAFDFTFRDLQVEGELRNMSSQGATLVLQTLAYDATNVCSTGTYSLAPE